MKYIFIAGAPGSKWSCVASTIYYNDNIDQSDYSEDRTYWHLDIDDEMVLWHIGAYFDPGMEFGNFFDRLDQFSVVDCEKEFHRPFSSTGIRIIKSHTFCHHLDFLSKHWPNDPIILVHREDNVCLDWWIRCGGFNITYPLYKDYYKDIDNMKKIIADQNRDLLNWRNTHNTTRINNSTELHQLLGIGTQLSTEKCYRDFKKNNIIVDLFWNT